MKNMTRSQRSKRKRVLLTVCLMLLVCVVSVGGTIAWLTASTTKIVNTFSPSNIGLTLTETQNSTDYDYKMVPGTTEAKNPTVTISGDVDAYLFVEVDEDWTVTSGSTTYDLKDYIAYTLNLTGWTQGSGSIPSNVWYIEVPATQMPKEHTLLAAGTYEADNTTYSYAANTVAFRADVTKEMMALITDANKPTLEFKAYAVQKDGLAGAEAAWAVRSTNP